MGQDDHDDGRYSSENLGGSSFRPRGRIGDELVELEGTVETRTAKAVLINWTNGGQNWIPKSQIHAELPDGDIVVFHITEWIAKKNGLV